MSFRKVDVVTVLRVWDVRQIGLDEGWSIQAQSLESGTGQQGF